MYVYELPTNQQQAGFRRNGFSLLHVYVLLYLVIITSRSEDSQKTGTLRCGTAASEPDYHGTQARGDLHHIPFI